VAVLANGSANGSYAAKALANIGRPRPEPQKGLAKGSAQTASSDVTPIVV
jgi:hypothetical protein